MSKQFNPPHVGEIISGILEEIDAGVRDFARAMDMAPSTASRILSGGSIITPEMWLRLQMATSLEKAEKETDLSQVTQIYVPEISRYTALNDHD